MDPIEVSALTGAGSAFVATVAYWAKSNHERRRLTRTALYYLLELHHCVHRTSQALTAIKKELLPEVRRAFEEKNITFDESSAATALQQALPHLEQLAFTELSTSFEGISEAYLKALADLARENPVLAYRLKGRDKVATLGEKLDKFARSAAGDLGSSEIDALKVQHSVFNQSFLEFSEQDLRRAVLQTSWECDVFTHIKVLKLLRSTRETGPFQEHTKSVRLLMERVIYQGIPTVNKST